MLDAPLLEQQAAGRLLPADPVEFRAKFNRDSFAFRHALAGHELFTIPRLAGLAERILQSGTPARFSVFDASKTGAGTKFHQMAHREKVADTVRRLEDGGVWMKLSMAHEADPEYGVLLEQISAELEALSGYNLRQETTWKTMTLFLASPGIVTPYHIDHETNFLLQIQGEKDVALYNARDRSLLTAEEIERFYAGAGSVDAANWRDDLGERGTVYRLVPGLAVHHPPLAPHWVRNGQNVSVSVSIGFCLRELDARAHVWQANYCLRRLGLRPREPGVSPRADRLKHAVVRAISKRNATDRDDILFSGVHRISAPLRLAKRLRGR
jgi:hypothetical protein